jgi:alpha-D-xyloside xylohydrolase
MNGPDAPLDPIAAVTGWKLTGPGTRSGTCPHGSRPPTHGTELRLELTTAAGRRAQLFARAIAPETWKLTLVPNGVEPPGPNPMLVPAAVAPAPPVKLAAKTRAGRLIVSGPELGLEMGIDPFSLRFVAPDGRAVLADNPADVDGLGRPAAPPLGFRGGHDGSSSITASFFLAPGEHLYGLGEKFTRLDKAGRRLVSWTVDALGSTSERSHKNVPFLWSSRGFGMFLATGARVTWDLGASSLQSWTFDAEASALDLYVFHGPDPSRILAAFTVLTGRPPALPDWSYGLWLSSGGTYRDQAAIEALLGGVARHHLPVDVIHIDPWWMRWRCYCDFDWDREAFPDPEGLIRRIHSLGLKLCLWEHPYISIESPLFEEGRKKGYFVLRPDGTIYVIDYGLSLAPRPDGRVRLAGPQQTWNAPVAIIDLTDPAARSWFQDLHRPLLRAGVDAFKTDFGEDIPADACFSDGRTGREMHNLYPLLYNAAVFEVTAEEKGRGIVWSRAATAGSQRYPVGWSGDPAADWASLAATVRGGLSAGMSGLAFWSHDIGGYRGTPDPELYVRWAQLGLFSSHSRMHGDSPREPWRFGEEALAIVRKFVRLRYRLFPYIRSAALEARATGLPVLRALPLAFPDDPNAAAWDHEYMFGPSLLAAPVIRPIEELEAAERRRCRPAGKGLSPHATVPLIRGGGPRFPVYLPPGKWFDYWTGRIFRGPAVVAAAAPLDILPLFVRAGAILPMTKAAERIPAGRIDPLELMLYPCGRSSYTLFEEEGRTDFYLRPAERGYALDWSGPVARRLIVRYGHGLRTGKAYARDLARGVRVKPVKSGRLRLQAPLISR